MKKLTCDRCGRVDTDKENIELAEKLKKVWENVCRRDGVEPRGIAACPNMQCTGELILTGG